MIFVPSYISLFMNLVFINTFCLFQLPFPLKTTGLYTQLTEMTRKMKKNTMKKTSPVLDGVCILFPHLLKDRISSFKQLHRQCTR